MKRAVLFLCLVMGAAEGFACSMEVDQNYTKNFLMAHAASFNDLSLSQVSGLSLINYGQSFSGGVGIGSCPDYITTSGRISMNHSPTAFKHCTYSVSVSVKTYIGSDLPDGAIEDVTFSNAVAACSSTPTGVKIPRKLPLRVKRPVIIRI